MKIIVLDDIAALNPAAAAVNGPGVVRFIADVADLIELDPVFNAAEPDGVVRSIGNSVVCRQYPAAAQRHAGSVNALDAGVMMDIVIDSRRITVNDLRGLTRVQTDAIGAQVVKMTAENE